MIWTCFQYFHLAPSGLYTGYLITTSEISFIIYCKISIVIFSVHLVVWSLQITYDVICAGSRQLEVAEYLLVGLRRGEGNLQFDDITLPPSLCFPGFPSLTINITVVLQFHRCAKTIPGENLQVMSTNKLIPSHIGLPLSSWSMNLERCLSYWYKLNNVSWSLHLGLLGSGPQW